MAKITILSRLANTEFGSRRSTVCHAKTTSALHLARHRGSRVPILEPPPGRGQLYADSSKTNYVSLIIHSLSIISVCSDVILDHMLVPNGGFVDFILIAITVVVSTRLITNLAAPGWMTIGGFGLLFIPLQTRVSTPIRMVLLLSNRTKRSIAPIQDYRDFAFSSNGLTPVALQPTLGAD